uniref:BED-type domain-containing protein n=1 Tax=Quercus lobata TaxID=97700 RepID=A0A7N2MU18_QUELO
MQVASPTIIIIHGKSWLLPLEPPKLEGFRRGFVRTITSSAIALFASSESFLFSQGKKHMEYGEGKKPKGRPRDKAWGMVDLLPNESKRWICPHCKNTYAGDVTRVKRHLARTGGGGIVPCPDVTPKIQQDALELRQAQAATATARKNGNIAVAQGGQLDNATFVGLTGTGTGPHNPDAGQNHLVEETWEMELSESDLELLSAFLHNEPNE